MAYWSFVKLTFTDPGSVNKDWIHPLSDVDQSRISQGDTIHQPREEIKKPDDDETFHVTLTISTTENH
jgi:hypothetical protein